jgi:hypothetical protein
MNTSELRTVARIASLVRLKNTRDGNPQYRVVFTDNTAALTEPDAAVNYEITNSQWRDVDVQVVTRAGHIVRIEPAS